MISWLNHLFKCTDLKLIFLWFVDLGNTDSVALVNESIDLLKSSLEKTKDGFVRIRDITANAIDGPSSSGQAAKKGEHLANSVRNVKDEAAIHMLLACKRNVILCDFFRTGMFSLSAHKQPSSEKQLGKSNEAVNSFFPTHIFSISLLFFCHLVKKLFYPSCFQVFFRSIKKPDWLLCSDETTNQRKLTDLCFVTQSVQDYHTARDSTR